MVNGCGHVYCSDCVERLEECPFCRRSGTPTRLHNDADIDDLTDNAQNLSLETPIQYRGQLDFNCFTNKRS